jgi:4a-hydroxytetrahydrobiopterin dehydratase
LAPIAERLDHHPDLSLSWRTVSLRLSTHSAGGVTSYDIALARELDPIIARQA